jgi:hypothetical protein
MHVYRNQKLDSRNFDLEEVSFIECHLKDCDLFYSGGDFDWQGTNFENCRFHWRGAAKNTSILFQTLGLVQQQPPVQIPKSSAPKPN